MIYNTEPIAYTGNIHTSNTFNPPPKILGASRAPESSVYADNTYGLFYGPKSVYQVPWPFPVYSVTAPPNEDMKFVDPGRPNLRFMDSGDILDKEEIFIGGKGPSSGGIPLFDKTNSRFKFKRPYRKS